MTDNAPDLPPLYDIEAALVALEEARGRQDEITAEVIRISDKLAPNIARHFAPDQLETAGLAMALAAASLPVLATGNDLARAMCTVMGFAGQRMVAEARAAAAVPVNACETDADAARRFAGQNIELQASVTHLNNDLDTLLWLHAEAVWQMEQWRDRVESAWDLVRTGKHEGLTLDTPRARIDKAIKLIRDYNEADEYGAGLPIFDELEASLIGETDGQAHAETRPDAVLPTTREELAKFFGGIRLAGSGAVVTGHFVEHALDLLDANERRIPCRCGAGNTHSCGRIGIEGVD